MLVCVICGERNPERARFCLACGHALEERPAARETRKTVTVLFCDVTGSTALGEQLDPESQRAVMSRYFEGMRTVLERHGGTVEKFIGDAVMAVFGIPHVHEDDALRAVRAAAEMRERLAELNGELERERGVRIAMRVGVNTGEVVAGDPSGRQKFVTGDPVVVAKRLESAAAPGDVLLGAETARLVRAATTLELLAPVTVKGKAAPIEAWRLVGVDADGPVILRRLDTPLVGREPELMRLLGAVKEVALERTCRLLTVVADAGIGKSRLARELAGRLGERARFLTGRCLPYGDGITFWPLREIVSQAGGLEAASEALGDEEEAALVVERIRGAIGSGESAGGEETFWAVRKLAEALARDRPLVLCVEDVHWAEPTLLELLEYLAVWIRDAPVLLFCLSRPDVVEEHPAWPGVRADALVTLPPLTEAETEELVHELAREAELDEQTQARIAGAAEGNPLYVEQLAELLAEEPDARHSLPPTIHALLAARLDRLGHEERAVLERAAVMGREFWRRAVVDVTPEPERAAVGSHLLALVRKNMVQPDTAERREDGFRFSHVLVRDAAYAAMPKEARAEVHERFARWIEENAVERATELEEIVGYHLEQAYRYREQLGPVDERARALAARAGELLGHAGRRAFARDDMPAAANLLDRAIALATEQEPVEPELTRQLSQAFWSTGEVARAEALLDGLIEAAAANGDRRMELYGILDRLERRQHRSASDLLAQAREAIPVFEAAADDVGLARAWRRIGAAHHMELQYAHAERAAERAARHAETAGDFPEYARSLDLVCIALLYGPTPADRGIRRCEEFLADVSRRPVAKANVLASLGGLRAMRADFDEARRCIREAAHVYESLGLRLAGAGLAHVAAYVELLADRPTDAVEWLRADHDALPHRVRAVHGVLLAEALFRDGAYEEARRLAEEGATIARGFVAQRIRVDALLALLEARAGELETALRLARAAVALAGKTDALGEHAEALLALAEVQRAAGCGSESVASARDALQLYERKGNLVAAERVNTLLAHAV
jgi:class 3 adenylate cyclase/tetratricopeptide (TPR) repeat protein